MTTPLSVLVLLNRLRGARDRVGALLPDVRDLHVYGGGALVAWGAAEAYPPAGWMVAGTVLMYLGLRRV